MVQSSKAEDIETQKEKKNSPLYKGIRVEKKRFFLISLKSFNQFWLDKNVNYNEI